MQVDQGAFGHLRPIPDYLSASLREVSPEGFDAESELSKIAQAFEAAEEDLVQLLHEPLDLDRQSRALAAIAAIPSVAAPSLLALDQQLRQLRSAVSPILRAMLDWLLWNLRKLMIAFANSLNVQSYYLEFSPPASVTIGVTFT